LTRPSLDCPTFHLPLDIQNRVDMTTDDALALLQYFSEEPYNNEIHPWYFRALLDAAMEVLAVRPAVVKVPTGKFDRAHVVGDLHGSLPDLSSALVALGAAGGGLASDAVVFNGDFVDRGAHGVEVLSCLLAILIASPDSVFLNRGNHEDSAVSGAYGFREEVETKLGRGLWPKVEEFFSALPLATLVPSELAGGAIVVHAGVGLPSLENLSKGAASVVKAGDRVTDLLWSDPDVEVKGLRDNESRGAGKFFGVDVAGAALDELKLKNFVRSHEQVYSGVQKCDLGDGKSLYTVFSVTDYPNWEGCNEGGILTLAKGEDSIPVPSRYSSEEFPMVSKTASSVHSEMTSLGTSLLTTLKTHKAVFHSSLLRASADGRRVTSEQWRSCMRDATGLDVGWSELEVFLAPHVKRFSAKTGEVTDSDLIDVEHFLARLEDGAGGEADKAFRRGRELYVLFKRLDADGSGGLSREEFMRGVSLLNENLPEGEKIEGDAEELFEAIDVDGNGIIDIEEWRAMLK